MTSRHRVLNIVERFFGISGADAEALIEDLETVNVAGGDWLFRQGANADALYFLVRGRLQVWINAEESDEQGKSRLLGEIAPGESVGEIGLLAGGLRTAGIRAIRDSLLLKLDRETFQRFAIEHPSLVMQLAGSIATRLTERTRTAPSGSRNLATVALLPLNDHPWLTQFCEQLTSELGKRGPTMCLRSHDLGRYGAPVAIVEDGQPIPDSLRHWLDDQENEHRLMLYVADAGNTSWSRLCMRQADISLLLADDDREPGPRLWERELLDSTGSAGARHVLLLRRSTPEAEISNTAAWLDERSVDFHLHLKAGHRDEVARIARMLTGEATGLVLSGGAARGFAEIGVYRALHEAGVQLDWIGGTSIGGIIGAAIARDLGPEYVLDACREAFVKGRPFGDYTIPVLSLLRGRRMERLTKKYLQGAIEDLPIPYFCVSTMLDTGDTHVHERGPIWRALRATAALPGMLPPAVVDRRLAIDGAVLNNLPVDIMRSKLIGKVIAVDVSSRRTYTVDYDELPSPWAVLRSRLLPGGPKYRVPGVISVLMKSAEIGTAAKMRELGNQADLLIRPPVHQFGLTEIKTFDRIVQAGYDEARERLATWLSRDEKSVSKR